MATSGQGTVTPEMWAHFDGDQMLEHLKKYDPNAKIITEDIGGGEGGSQGKGFRVEMDTSKLPKSTAGTLGLDLRESNFGQLKNPNGVVHDENYGDVTNSANIVKPKDPAWTHYAPLAIAAIASMGAALPAAAAAEGVGAGAGAWGGAALADGAGTGIASGLTSAVTGSGLTGINTAGMPSWLVQLASKSPTLARQIADGNFNPLSLLPVAGNAVGINPSLVSGGMTLAQLARQQRGP